MDYSESHHRPLHIYEDNTWYFISASTANRAKLLSTPAHCYVWCTELFSAVAEFNLRLEAWVLLLNHYHLLLRINRGRDLSTFIKYLHGRTSFRFNNLDGCRGRSVWHGYWDVCIRSEVDFWTRFNYIHYNPVRHGYVQNPEDWEFSSCRLSLRSAGMERRCDPSGTELTELDDF